MFFEIYYLLLHKIMIFYSINLKCSNKILKQINKNVETFLLGKNKAGYCEC